MSIVRVRGKNAEVLSGCWTNGAEVIFIERQHVDGAVAQGQDGDRGVCQSDSESAVFRDDPPGALDVILVECCQFVGPAANLIEKKNLRINATELLNQKVDFGKNK